MCGRRRISSLVNSPRTAEGRLHLAIVKRRAFWSCSDVVLDASLGYGEYRFAVRKERLDDNAVFGMFLWDATAARLHFREVDIELSRWGNLRKQNAQFAVQPYQRAAISSASSFPKGWLNCRSIGVPVASSAAPPRAAEW